MLSQDHTIFSLTNLLVLMSLTTLVHCNVKLNEEPIQLNSFRTLKNTSSHDNNNKVHLQFAEPYISPLVSKKPEDTVRVFVSPTSEKLFRRNATEHETQTSKSLTAVRNQLTERTSVASKTQTNSPTPATHKTKQDSLENYQTDLNNPNVKQQLKTHRAQQHLIAATTRPTNNAAEPTASTTSSLVIGSKPFTMVMIPKQYLNNITPTVKPDLISATSLTPRQHFKQQPLDMDNNISESRRVASVSSPNRQTIVSSGTSSAQKQPSFSNYKPQHSDYQSDTKDKDSYEYHRVDTQTHGKPARKTTGPESSYYPSLYAQYSNAKETYAYPSKSVSFKVDKPTMYVTDSTRQFYTSTDKPLLQSPTSKYPSNNDNTWSESNAEYNLNMHPAKPIVKTEQDQYHKSDESKDIYKILLENLLKSKYNPEMELKRSGLDDILDQHFKKNKSTPEYIEDYDIDTEMNCNLRSTRDITDGQCTSSRPIVEAVCADRCLVYKSTSLKTNRYKSTIANKQQVEALHCVNGDTKLLRVKLLCQDGAVLNNVVKVVTNCRCKLHPVQPQIRKTISGSTVPQVESEYINNDQ